MDKTCALEHVTRDRVRGGQKRRPPTRIHLKEVRSADWGLSPAPSPPPPKLQILVFRLLQAELVTVTAKALETLDTTPKLTMKDEGSRADVGVLEESVKVLGASGSSVGVLGDSREGGEPQSAVA